MPPSPPSPATLLRRGEMVIEGRLPEETVLLRTDTGQSVRLNPTAAWLWDKLDSPLTVEELGEQLRGEFGLGEDQARSDAAGFAQALGERGFLALDRAGD